MTMCHPTVSEIIPEIEKREVKIRPIILLKNIDEWMAFFLASSFPVHCSTVQLIMKEKRFYLSALQGKSKEKYDRKMAAIIQWKKETWSITFAKF